MAIPWEPGSPVAAAFRRAAPATKKPMFTPGSVQPARRPPVSLSGPQAANRQVNQILAPQVRSQQAFNTQQNQTIQNFAQALLGKLQPVAGQVGQAYDQAIQQTGALSGQAAQFLAGQNPTGQVQQLLQSAGAPQAQQQQIGNQLGQTFGGGAGVLAYLTGAVPGGQLAADKAAQVSEASQYPLLAGLKGQQDLASALWQQRQSRSDLEAQRPQLYQNALQNIQRNNQARQSASATAQYRNQQIQGQQASRRERAYEFDVTTRQKQNQFEATNTAKQAAADFLQWYRTEGLKQSAEKIDQKAREFGVTAAQRDKQIKVAEKNAATRAASDQARARHNAAADAERARHNAATEQAAADRLRAKAAQEKKSGGITPATYAGLKKQARSQADLFYFGKVVKDSSGQIDPDKSIAGIDYGQALNQLRHGYSLTRPDAIAILNDFYAPGERGRPLTPAGRRQKNQTFRTVTDVLGLNARTSGRG